MNMKERFVDVVTNVDEGADVAPEVLTLLETARDAARKAYAPYSKFRVGAAALLDNGEVVSGSNQENAAYPSGLCAERVTVFYANSRFPEAKILRLVIYAETDKGPVRTPIAPCGACRQVLLEKESAQGAPIAVSLAGAAELYTVPSVERLLPLSFLPKSLKGD